MPGTGGGPPEQAPALSGAAEKQLRMDEKRLSAAPESRPCARWRMGVDRRLFPAWGSIIFARLFPVVFDSGASGLVVAALFFLSVRDFCFFAFFRDDESGIEEIFQPDPCQFPIPGQTAGFFGDDHDLSGGIRYKQTFPHIFWDGCCIHKIEYEPDAAAGLVDMLSAGTGGGADEDFFQIIVREEVHCVVRPVCRRGDGVCLPVFSVHLLNHCC